MWWCGVSGAARGKGTGGTFPPPPSQVERPKGRHHYVFLQNFPKKNVSNIFIMKWPKSEEKIGIGVRGGGGGLEKLQGLPTAFLRFFFCKILHFFHLCKMKWPKSEEKVENGGGGGLEKLGGPPGGVPPHCKHLAAPLYGVVWCGVVWCGVVW